MITLVLFSTSTCQYCKPVKQIIEENIRPAYSEDELTITQIVIDADRKSQEVAQHWAIQGVPTGIIIKRKEGEIAQEVARLVGSEQLTHSGIVYAINSFLDKNDSAEKPSKL